MRALRILALAAPIVGAGLFGGAAPAAASEYSCRAVAFRVIGVPIRATAAESVRADRRAACRVALRKCRRKLNRLRQRGRFAPFARCRAVRAYALDAARRGGGRYADDYRADDYRADDYRTDDYRADDYRADDDRGDDYRADDYRDDRYQDDDYRADDYRGDYDQGGQYRDDGRRSDGYQDDGYRDQDDAARYDNSGDYFPTDPGYVDQGSTGQTYLDERGDVRDGRRGSSAEYQPPYSDGASSRGDPHTDAAYTDEFGGYCNFSACDARYKTFRASDCSFQPFEGPRKRCETVARKAALAPPPHATGALRLRL